METIAPDLSRWGSNVAGLRRYRGMTQARLAQLCDIDAGTVSRIERGVHEPSRYIKQRIANQLGCDDMFDLFPEPRTQQEIAS